MDFTLFETLLDIVTAHYVTVLPTTYNTATEERSNILSVLNLLEICCRPVTLVSLLVVYGVSEAAFIRYGYLQRLVASYLF